MQTESEKKISHDGIEKLAKDLITPLLTTCFYRVEGWWIFEACFDKHVRQYHQENGKVSMENFLGYKTKESSLAVVLNNEIPEDSYVSYRFSNGSVCDLTNKHREIEMRFYCPSKDKLKPEQSDKDIPHHISSVVEPGSCIYQLNFYSTHLCQLNSFKKREDKVANMINCYESSGVELSPNPMYRKIRTKKVPKPIVVEEKNKDPLSFVKNIIGSNAQIKIGDVPSSIEFTEEVLKQIQELPEIKELLNTKVIENLEEKDGEIKVVEVKISTIGKSQLVEDKTEKKDEKKSKSAPSQEKAKDEL